MEFLDQKTILLDKVESELDKFVLDFVKILEKHSKYVIVSGYVAILFGRNRSSEDVDFFVEKFQDFGEFIEELFRNGYWIINEDPEKASSMLDEGLALRIARKGSFQPNAEIKYPKRDTDRYSLENHITVKLRSGEIKIGSLELNIAFKLFLGSGKDFEDAMFLYKLLKEKLDMEKLDFFVGKLKVKDAFRRYLS